ncbi:ATP-binding protein, partial [Streptomyces yangpuensis]
MTPPQAPQTDGYRGHRTPHIVDPAAPRTARREGDEPVTALWPARSARPAEHRTAAGHVCGPHRGRGRLVGRGAEMGRITAALAAARSGQGGALFVTGEPGIGKTRLATAALAAAASADMVTVRGRASTVGPPVP